MAARAYRITPATRRVLTDVVSFAGPRVTITEHVGAAWSGVKLTLEKMGAVYRVGTSSFDFEADQDARTLVAAALAAGSVMGAAQADGYVPTPGPLAQYLVDRHAELWGNGNGLMVLEPSAGTGPLVDAIAGTTAADNVRTWLTVHAVEPDARRLARIEQDDRPNVQGFRATFEEFAASAAALGTRYDRIVMNPPFSVPGDAFIWIKHVVTAYSLLKPGGRLVAIVPAAVLDARRVGVRRYLGIADLIARHGGGEANDVDAFADSGVKVATAIIWLDRPLTDQPAALPERPFPYVEPDTCGIEPIMVSRLILTHGAGQTTPVQMRDDHGWGKVRTVRYGGGCAECGRPVWFYDDGGDASLGDDSGTRIEPYSRGDDGHGFTAPGLRSFVLCLWHANVGEVVDAWTDRARAYWTTAERVSGAAGRMVARLDTPPAPVVVEPAPAVDDEWGTVLDGDQYALPV